MEESDNNEIENKFRNFSNNEPSFPLRGVYEPEDEFEERINYYINYQKIKENCNR